MTVSITHNEESVNDISKHTLTQASELNQTNGDKLNGNERDEAPCFLAEGSKGLEIDGSECMVTTSAGRDPIGNHIW